MAVVSALAVLLGLVLMILSLIAVVRPQTLQRSGSKPQTRWQLFLSCFVTGLLLWGIGAAVAPADAAKAARDSNKATDNASPNGAAPSDSASLSPSPLSAPTSTGSLQANRSYEGNAVDPWSTLTPEAFHAKFDALALADGSDTIKQMRKAKNGIVVLLHDERFQHGIKELKKLNLANGKFNYEVSLLLQVNGEGKLSQIDVYGSRSDPVNLGRFIGAVGIVNDILNPGQADKENIEFLSSLKLMRGDDDTSAGKPISAFNRGGAFACLTMPSTVTMKIGCRVVPRS